MSIVDSLAKTNGKSAAIPEDVFRDLQTSSASEPLWNWREKSQLECSNLTKSTCDASRSACLFDLEEDPCEYNNIISEHHQVSLNVLTRV